MRAPYEKDCGESSTSKFIVKRSLTLANPFSSPAFSWCIALPIFMGFTFVLSANTLSPLLDLILQNSETLKFQESIWNIGRPRFALKSLQSSFVLAKFHNFFYWFIKSHCWNNMNWWLSAQLCSCDLNWHIQLMSAITNFLSQLVNICQVQIMSFLP